MFIEIMANGLVVALMLISVLLLVFGQKHIEKRIAQGVRPDAIYSNFSEERVNKWVSNWKKFNIVAICFFLVFTTVSIMRCSDMTQQLRAKELAETTTSQKVVEQPKVTSPPPAIKIESTPVLNQEVYFYCLDKSVSKKNGLTADVIKACTDAALYRVETPVVPEVHDVPSNVKYNRYV